MSRFRYQDEVTAYLELCERYPQLNRKYHPTEDGAVKMIYHRTKDQARQIRSAFAYLASRR